MAYSADININLNYNSKGASAAISDLNKLSESQNKTAKSGSALDSAGKKSLSTFIAQATIIRSLQREVFELGKNTIQTAVKVDNMNRSWKAMAGSNAPQILSTMRNILKDYPYTLDEVNNGFKKLYNAGVPMAKIEPTFQALGATAKVTGYDVDRLTLAMTQMYSKGKVNAQDMRQMAEAGIGPWKLLADKMGISATEVERLSKEGKLGMNEINLLVEAMGDKYLPAMGAQIDTVGGQWQIFKNRLLGVSESLQPLVDKMTNFLKDMNKYLEDGKVQWDELDGKYKQLIISLTIMLGIFTTIKTMQLFNFMIAQIGTFITNIQSAVGSLRTLYQTTGVQTVVNGIKSIGTSLVDIGSKALTAATDVASAMSRMAADAIRAGTSSAGAGFLSAGGWTASAAAAWAAVVPILIIAAKVLLIGAAVLAVIGIIWLIVENWELIKTFIIAIWTAIWNFIMQVLQGIIAFFQPFIDFIISLWNMIWAVVQFVWTLIVQIIQTAISIIVGIFQILWSVFVVIWELIKGVVTVVWEVILLIIRTVINIIIAIWNTLAPIFTAIWDVIKAVVIGVWEFLKSAFQIFVSILITIWNAIKAPFEAVINFFKMVFTAVWNVLKAVFEQFKEGLITIWNAIKAPFEAVINFIKNIFTTGFNAVTKIVTGAKDVVVKVFEGIRDTVKWVVDGIVGFFTGIGDKIKAAFSGIGDFIRGLNPFGMQLMLGVEDVGSIDGIAGNRQNIINIHTKDTPTMNDLAKGGFIG
jgi:tape measure domain-containing protein